MKLPVENNKSNARNETKLNFNLSGSGEILPIRCKIIYHLTVKSMLDGTPSIEIVAILHWSLAEGLATILN